MKKDNLLSCLWGAVLAFVLALGTAGSLATAFNLTMEGNLVLIFALAALVCGACGGLKHGGLVILGVFVLGALHLWRGTDFLLQTEALLNHISRFYNRGYGWPVISWSGENLTDVPVTQPLAVVGCLVGLATAWTVCRKGRALWAILVCGCVMAPCVVLNDTVPAAGYLAAVLYGGIMLLMTQTIRRRKVREGNRLAAMLAVPLALGLGALFMAVTREGYEPPAEDLGMRIVAWFQDLEYGDSLTEKVVTAINGLGEEKISLKNTGPRGKQQFQVMEVTAAVDGPLYLRGQAYDVYDGYNWVASDGSWTRDGDYPSGLLLGYVEITTRSTHDVLYYPHMPEAAAARMISGGRVENQDKQKTYSFAQVGSTDKVTAAAMEFSTSVEDYAAQAMEQYLQLPAETKSAAQAYLKDYVNYISPISISSQSAPLARYMQKAERIASLVQGSAVYDLGTRRMPAGEQDFAMWFLEDSDTGYCVHFATATTVLLRAAGIPARYVTGYLADGVAGEAVTVLGADAHAWVEYWVPGIGWQLLEPTPGGGGETEASTAPPRTPEVSTQPPASTEEDQPVQTRPDPALPDDGPGDDPSEQSTTAPAEPGLPGLPGMEGNGPVLDLSWLWPVLKVILWCAAAAAAVAGQWKLRLYLRQKRRIRGSCNEQALTRWRETVRLAKLLRQTPPEQLHQLAQKAKFSQHQLTREELQCFDAYLAQCVALIREKPAVVRLIFRLVLAVY